MDILIGWLIGTAIGSFISVVICIGILMLINRRM